MTKVRIFHTQAHPSEMVDLLYSKLNMSWQCIQGPSTTLYEFCQLNTFLTTVTTAGTLTICEAILTCLPTGSTNPWVAEYGLGDDLSVRKSSCPLAKTSYVLLPGSCGVQGVLAINNGELLTNILVCGP